MALSPVHRRSVPDEVFDQLVAEVTGGDLGPGEPALARQRLATAGLVDVRQGGSTTVRDFRRLGGLDLLPRLLVTGGELDLAVARSILEARLHVGPKIAELAAVRSGLAIAGGLRDTVRLLEAEADGVRRQQHALAFWDQVVAGADSITFRLMFNSMRAAYEPVLDALAVVMSAEVDRVETYDALTDAIEAGDGPAARERAHDLLAVATESLTDAIDAIDALEG